MIKHVLFAALFGLVLLPASGRAAVYTVDSTVDIAHFQDTGLVLNPGTIYDFVVLNPATIWSAGSDLPFSRKSTAAGIPLSRGYGDFSSGGFTALFGELVGEAGTQFFHIGLGNSLSGLSGDLKVGYWDSYYPDNSGTQTLQVSSSVPELSTWAMMILGFGGVALQMRRRQATIAVSA